MRDDITMAGGANCCLRCWDGWSDVQREYVREQHELQIICDARRRAREVFEALATSPLKVS